MNQAYQKKAIASMSAWLEQPDRLGKKPSKIVCTGEFTLYNIQFCVCKFKPSFFGKWMVGVCGGFKNESSERCEFILSDMKEYREETAKQECVDMFEKYREQKLKQIQAKLKGIQKQIIQVCMNAVGTNVDTICAYCYAEGNTVSFNMFTLVGKKVRTLSQLNVADNAQRKLLDDGITQWQQFLKLSKTYCTTCPIEMKLVYDVKASDFSVSYTFPPSKNRNLSAEGFDEWVESYRHLKAENTTPIRSEISLKKEWTVKQSGLRGTMISERAALNGDTLVYFIEYDKIDNAGYWESQLRCLNLKTLNESTLFSERHVIRDIGIFEAGKQYFTSFSGTLYCINENNGDILWATKIGKGNASWEVIADEKNVYMFNDHMYAVDKAHGELVWESPDDLQHSKCSMAMNEKYVYRCKSGGFVFCMDKANGTIVWKYGNDAYNGHCILLSEDVLLFAATMKGFGKVCMLNAATGELISETVMESGCSRRPVVVDNLIFLGCESGEVKCYEMSSEYKLTEKYSFLSDSSVTTEVTLDENLLWFATEKGYLYCLDICTGEELRKRKKVGSAPRWITIYGGGVLVLSDKGQVEFFSKSTACGKTSD